MPSIKEYKTKLHSLKNIEKMTRTMKLVAASKLRQAFLAQSNARLYAQELTALIARLAASVESAVHPLLTPHRKVKNALLVVFTSDKGLCGGFNNNLIRRVLAWLPAHKAKYEKIELSSCGKRGFMSLRRHLPIRKNYEGITARPTFQQAIVLGEELSRLFLSGEYDEIYLAYNRFHNSLSQKPQITKLLPIESQSLTEGAGMSSAEYLFEPSQPVLLDTLIRQYMDFKIFYTLLENAAGEHGARMTAMDKASQNADELIDKYTLLRNRARQAAITKELIEIVSGAEALK